jgi:lysophospholipase L1-like esterase
MKKDAFVRSSARLHFIFTVALFVLSCFIPRSSAIDRPSTDRIRLEDQRIRVVALGDSVVWGQGLRDNEKFFYLIAESLAKYGSVQLQKETVAHSGAIIGSRDGTSGVVFPGEVPSSFPTILQQSDNFRNSPEFVDYVIMDGGANDVGITWVIDPAITIEILRSRVRQYCYHDMIELLQRTTAKFRNARIVVTGYYQGISEQTDSDALEAILVGLGFLTPAPIFTGALAGIGFEAGRSRVIENCRFFAEESRAQLRAAIDAINAALPLMDGKPRVVFADPNFGPENALFAPASWLFQPRTELFPVTHFLDAEDPLAAERQIYCGTQGCSFDEILKGEFSCFIRKSKCEGASSGHPNQRGARAYANAIASALGFVVVDPARSSGGDHGMEFPFHTVSFAAQNVPRGGTIRIKTGFIPGPLQISTACTLEACGGPVTLGR